MSTMTRTLMTMLLLALGGASAEAREITFLATGAVTSIFGDQGPKLANTVALGDALRFTYTFESTTAPESTNPGFVVYRYAVKRVRVQVADNDVTLTPCATCNHNITVVNDYFIDGVYQDGYQLAVFDSVGAPFTSTVLALSGNSSEPIDALTSAALPVVPPDPLAFLHADVTSQAAFFLAFYDPSGTVEIQASITSLTMVLEATAEQLLVDLAQMVVAMNVQAGVENSLDAKLQNAIAALDDSKRGDKYSAINMLQALINEVNAQRGSRLTDAQATQLVHAAMVIIYAIERG